MDFTMQKLSGGVLVSLTGQLTTKNADALKELLISTLDEVNKKIVLELSRVSKIDASSLASLVIAYKYARGVGGEIVLLTPHPSVLETLEMIRLHMLFEIFSSQESAIKWLAA